MSLELKECITLARRGAMILFCSGFILSQMLDDVVVVVSVSASIISFRLFSIAESFGFFWRQNWFWWRNEVSLKLVIGIELRSRKSFIFKKSLYRFIYFPLRHPSIIVLHGFWFFWSQGAPTPSPRGHQRGLIWELGGCNAIQPPNFGKSANV